jgi:phosphopantothenoylcysteine decarboxylase/phosphopantothenate--cysteine ligase
LASRKLRVLVTGGPTAVGLDPMRIISNRSTGEMARLIAASFAKKGAAVTLLLGQQASSQVPLPGNVKLKSFFYYDDLASLLMQELKSGWDVVVHAAAVSDLEPAKVSASKLSSRKAFTLKLVPTRKLINTIKKAVPDAVLVGFKFETRIVRAFILDKTRDLFAKAGCDVVLANCQNEDHYSARLIEPCGRMSVPVGTREKIVKALVAKVDQILL